MFRCYCLPLCLLCSLCSAETIVQDGDYFPSLFTRDSLTMTGGTIDRLFFVGPQADVSGGYIRGVQLEEGVLNLTGGGVQGITRKDDVGSGAATINLHGYYFQVYDRGLNEYNSYRVQGWLLDWTFVDFSIVNNLGRFTRFLPNHFITYASEGVAGDTNGDWQVDVQDMNLVRNTFGNIGDGDVTKDGHVGIDDLNVIRNGFGGGTFTLMSDYPDQTTEYFYSGAVPEPSAIALLAVTLSVLRFSRFRLLQWTCRRSPVHHHC